MITTNEKATNWLLYVKHSTDETSNMQVRRAWPAAFSQSNEFLRIGTQLFRRHDGGDYIAVPGFDSTRTDHPPCADEFVGRGHFTVLARRRRVVVAETYDSGLTDDKLETLAVDFLRMESNSTTKTWDDAGDSDTESLSDSSDSSLNSEDAGYETWTQGSTEHSDDFADDIITPWAGPTSDVDDETTDSDAASSDSGSSDPESLQDDGNQTSSGSEDSDVEPSAVIGYGIWHDDDGSDSSDDGCPLPQVATLQNWNPRPHPGLEASITIHDSSSHGVPMKVFHFTKPLPFILYNSPPAIHPSESLVVWPLSAGDVLFADFLAKTYFIRKLRPSTSHSEPFSCIFPLI